MTTWIEAIKDRLVAASFGTFGTDLYIGGMAGESDPTLAIAEYGGSTEETMGSAAPAVEQPMLHLATRGSDYIDTRARLIAARSAVMMVNTTVSSVHFISVTSGNRTIKYVGQDAQGRFMFTADLQVELANAS